MLMGAVVNFHVPIFLGMSPVVPQRHWVWTFQATHRLISGYCWHDFPQGLTWWPGRCLRMQNPLWGADLKWSVKKSIIVKIFGLEPGLNSVCLWSHGWKWKISLNHLVKKTLDLHERMMLWGKVEQIFWNFQSSNAIEMNSLWNKA